MVSRISVPRASGRGVALLTKDFFLKPGLAAKVPESNPLTPFSHPYRFGKMHDKIHWAMHDEIEP